MGVACVFSKIQPKATILAIISLLVVALVTHVLPVLGLILFICNDSRYCFMESFHTIIRN